MTITVGNHAVALEVGSIMTVTAGAAGCTVTRTNASGASLATPLAAGVTTFGPYFRRQSFTLVDGSNASSFQINAIEQRPDLGVTCAIAGDSRVQQHYDQSSTAITGRPRWFRLGNALARQRLNLVANAGVSGDTAQGLLNRLSNATFGAGFGAIGSQAAVVTTSPGVIPFAPRYCFVSIGFNDIITNGGTASATMPIIIKIYKALFAAGITPVALTIPLPAFATGGMTTAKARELDNLNRKIRDYVAATPGMQIVDIYNSMLAPTSANIESLSTYFRDATVHENNLGGYREAQALKSWILATIPSYTDILPASNAATIAADGAILQLQPNPLLTGSTAATGTNVSGNIPTGGISINRGGSPSACVCSVASRADGFGQDMSMEVTATAAGDAYEARFPSQHANAVVGATYIAVAEISASGAGGAALTSAGNLSGIQFYLQYYDGTTNYFSWENAWASTDGPYPESFTLVSKTRPLTIPGTGTPSIFRINLTATFAGAGTARLTIGRVGLIRIS